MTDDIWRMPKPGAVLEAIEEWRSRDLRKVEPEQVINTMRALRDRLEFGVGQCITFTPQKLWRVRKRAEADTFAAPGDFWEPPANRARLNRCNQAGCPVLYCSKDLATALDESRIANGDELLLVKYRARTQLRLHRIVGSFDPRPNGRSVFDDDGLLAYRIMREFLRTEFTKPVGEGTERLYLISAAVCEVWASDDGSDGWIYPSVRSPLEGNDNVALAPDAAHHKLTIESAHWCIAEDVQASHRFGGSGHALPGIRLRQLKTAEVAEQEVRWRERKPADRFPAFAVRRR